MAASIRPGSATSPAATWLGRPGTHELSQPTGASLQQLAADPSRVISRLFVPGQEGFEHQESLADAVLTWTLALDEGQVRSSLEDLVNRFDGRHRDLSGTFRRHARELADRLDPDRELSETRKLLLGATFTSEYAIEGAALCNPSKVAHPVQARTVAGSLQSVMSIRGIGEGHRSSIGFRTGVIDAAGGITIDDAAPFATVGAAEPTPLEAAVLRSELARVDGAGEVADFVLDGLGERFTRAALDQHRHRYRHCATTRPPWSSEPVRTKAFRMWSLLRHKPAMLTDSLAARLTEIPETGPSPHPPIRQSKENDHDEIR